MKVEQFSYDLPAELIAQRPPVERDGGRLMLLGRRGGEVAHRRILDLPDLLPEGCLLVVNDTRVFPARLWARRSTGGKVELLLLEQLDALRWTCMVRASKRLRPDERLSLGRGRAVVVEGPVVQGRGVVLLDAGDVDAFGAVPLPPYITRPDEPDDRERYQTVYARRRGSVAAPTAGLHFTEDLLSRIRRRGIEVASITLHVGPGTFRPVRSEEVEDHQMEQERFSVSERAAQAIHAARARGRPVVAVGTTVVRTLEATGAAAGEGRTDLFITPGHAFEVVDGLLTNFHLPCSTLLMLVSAFAGTDAVLAAYRVAVTERYRFYSYGDAMLIL